jgi:hypothetical protein
MPKKTNFDSNMQPSEHFGGIEKGESLPTGSKGKYSERNEATPAGTGSAGSADKYDTDRKTLNVKTNNPIDTGIKGW